MEHYYSKHAVQGISSLVLQVCSHFDFSGKVHKDFESLMCQFYDDSISASPEEIPRILFRKPNAVCRFTWQLSLQSQTHDMQPYFDDRVLMFSFP